MIYNLFESILNFCYTIFFIMYLTCGTLGVVLLGFLAVTLLGATAFAFCFFAAPYVHILFKKIRGQRRYEW